MYRLDGISAHLVIPTSKVLPTNALRNQWLLLVSSHSLPLLTIEVLHDSHVAWQERWKCFALERTFVPIGKRIYCYCHATCLPCKTSILRERRKLLGLRRSGQAQEPLNRGLQMLYILESTFSRIFLFIELTLQQETHIYINLRNFAYIVFAKLVFVRQKLYSDWPF